MKMGDKVTIALIMFYLVIGVIYLAKEDYWKGFYFLSGAAITLSVLMMK